MKEWVKLDMEDVSWKKDDGRFNVREQYSENKEGEMKCRGEQNAKH